MIIANRVKSVMTNLVFRLVKMEFAQKICTVTLMTQFAFYHANLIRIVLVVIDASTAIVCNLARTTANVQTVNNIVTRKHRKKKLNLSKLFHLVLCLGKPTYVLRNVKLTQIAMIMKNVLKDIAHLVA